MRRVVSGQQSAEEETMQDRTSPQPAGTAGPPETMAETVGDTVARDYRAAAVFERHGIDFCCGGAVTLADACRRSHVDPAALAAELAAATSTPPRRPDQDPAAWTLTRLVDHITATHHAYLRDNTGRIGAHARKIDEVHGEQHPELASIVTVYSAMAAELTAHLQEEEETFFPAARRAEKATRAGGAVDPQDAETLALLTEKLTREHEVVGGALHQIRDLSMGYALPGDACATYTITYQSLQRFETDLHRHVHLENNILFPRVTEMLRNAARSARSVEESPGSDVGAPGAIAQPATRLRSGGCPPRSCAATRERCRVPDGTGQWCCGRPRAGTACETLAAGPHGTRAPPEV